MSLKKKVQGCCKRLGYSVPFMLVLLLLVLTFVSRGGSDPFIPGQASMNTSIALDVPSDGHYRYVCLNYDGWNGCIGLPHGNLMFNITTWTTDSETYHHISSTRLVLLLLLIMWLYLSFMIWNWSKFLECCEITTSQSTRHAARDRKTSMRKKVCIGLLIMLVCALATLWTVSLMVTVLGSSIPEYDPRVSTPLNKSLVWSIPSDGHYRYVCLSAKKLWQCEQLKLIHHGNIKFKITAERTTSETFHHLHKIVPTIFLYCSMSFGVLSAIIVIIGLLTVLILCCKHIYKATIKYRSTKHLARDIETQHLVYVKQIAEGQINQSNPGSSLDNPCFEDSDNKTGEKKVAHGQEIALPAIERIKEQSNSESSKKVVHSRAVRFDSQIDTTFDAGTDIGGIIDQHVKETEKKIKACICSLEAPMRQLRYDCFIIYNSNDEGFVNEKLVPFFQSRGISYCDQEHFVLGKDVFDNINTCIVQSRRVVAVLSKSFFKDGYCMKIFNAARGHAVDNSVQDFLISIKIKQFDIPRKYTDICTSTYADLSEDINDKRKWIQLKKALTDIRLASVTIELIMSSEYRPTVLLQEDVSDTVGHSRAVTVDPQIDLTFDARPNIGGIMDQHVHEMNEKIRACINSLKAPLKQMKYDCFVIYSRDNEDFVNNKLIPFFKSKGINYGEHQEHFQLGKEIIENVNTCIVQSRRVVAVLSKSFFKSGYCKKDLDIARDHAARCCLQDFLISIKIKQVDIPHKYTDICTSAYADLSENSDEEKKWLQIWKAITDIHLASMRIELSSEFCTPVSSEQHVSGVLNDQLTIDNEHEGNEFPKWKQKPREEF